MEYSEFLSHDHVVWHEKAIGELKEKSFDETLKWLVDQNLSIDAYADHYLSTPEERSAIQNAQRKNTKCTLFSNKTEAEKTGVANLTVEVEFQERENTVSTLLNSVIKLKELHDLKKITSDDLSLSIQVVLDTNYLLTIAKVRALRFLTHKISTAYKSSVNISFDGKTNKLQYRSENEHINIVRGTTMAMAGIVGGCNTVKITPFDRAENEFSTRIARNVMNLLNEEAYLNEVADPAAGSFFIENLTFTLIQETWKRFVVQVAVA